MNFPQNYHSTLPALKANYIIFRNVEHSPKKKKILVKEQNFVIEKYWNFKNILFVKMKISKLIDYSTNIVSKLLRYNGF